MMQVNVKRNDTPMSLARAWTGDWRRFGELIAANPPKSNGEFARAYGLDPNGRKVVTFAGGKAFYVGQVLSIPDAWVATLKGLRTQYRAPANRGTPVGNAHHQFTQHAGLSGMPAMLTVALGGPSGRVGLGDVGSGSVPVGGSCDTLNWCVSGASCVDGTCVSDTPVSSYVGCTSDTDCTGGLTCNGGACTEGPSSPPAGCSPACAEEWQECFNGNCVAKTCSTTGDCGPGYMCDGTGHCARNPTNAGECNQDSECPSGQACIRGNCTPNVTDTSCSKNEDCPLGQICNSGKCGAGCEGDVQCGAGYTCQSGKCVKTATAGCTANSDCASGLICQGGNCVKPAPNPVPCTTSGKSCGADGDCCAGLTCNNGTCGAPVVTSTGWPWGWIIGGIAAVAAAVVGGVVISKKEDDKKHGLPPKPATEHIAGMLGMGEPKANPAPRRSTKGARITKAQPGTVISATIREEDLVPAFMSELERHNPKAWAYLEQDRADAMRHGGFNGDAMSYFFNDQLFDAMQTIAPRGTYFGSHPGDGADWGFWSVKDM